MKIAGIAGPLPELVAAFVAKPLRPILLGQDPVAHESCRTGSHCVVVHGRRVTRCWQSARSTARCGT